MELSLIRSLMEKQFYEEHRGSRCPMKLFSKDIQKVKRVIDKAMDDYNRSVSPDEVEALFLSDNPYLSKKSPIRKKSKKNLVEIGVPTVM